jgi:TRAP transporter TAXI family solute receptor
MQQRLALLVVLTGFAVLALSGFLAEGASPVPTRIAFQIATGSSGGSFFPVGEALAGLLSHPPGISRCEAAPVCGPSGLVISVRTSQGPVDNVSEVNQGDADSALAQADIVAAAIKGHPPFRGRAGHIRVIGALYDENIYLVASAKSKIRKITDLARKRVWLDNEGAGSDITMRQILSAYGVAEKSLHLVRSDEESAGSLLRAGKVDAFFAVGTAPLGELSDLFANGSVRLIAIDGAGRNRLVKAAPSFAPSTIPAGSFAGTSPIATVATRALWIVRDSVPDNLVYGITKALFQPSNRAALAASHPAAVGLDAGDATRNLPAALHAGAARYYREQGQKL